MIDWEHLTKMTTKHEAALVAFLASIERPNSNDDDNYAAFYNATEEALTCLADARRALQKEEQT